MTKYPVTFYQEYFYIYVEWLMWRLNNSQTNKKFEQYFDIYAIGYCGECVNRSNCPVYSKLESQRLNLDINQAQIVSNKIKLVFVPPKNKNIVNIRFEKASDGIYHYTSFKVCIINRYAGKCKCHIIFIDRDGSFCKETILSKRQREYMGKVLWDDESKYLQPSSHKSILGHSNSKNARYYSRQSQYEMRNASNTSVTELSNIKINGVVNITIPIKISYIYAQLHNTTRQKI